MNDETVKKARAAVEWCRHASEHARDNGARPWVYPLIPHDKIDAETLQRLASTCAVP